MDIIQVQGGKPLKGNIKISGAKNAALPLMMTCLLTDETVTLENVPCLSDITSMENLISSLGVTIHSDSNYQNDYGKVLQLNAAHIDSTCASYELVRKMRASILVLGPLLARFHKAKVSLPGGCAIGARPVDMHLSAFEQMGAKIELKDGYVHAHAPHGLTGAEIHLPFASVGATENIILAATLAKGTTTLHNAAREPEIIDLIKCLNKQGADIQGAGESLITINGVSKLNGCHHRVIDDRIELLSYAIAAAITNGEILLETKSKSINESTKKMLGDVGVELKEVDQGYVSQRHESGIRNINLITAPFPGFPTDLQAQMMVLLSYGKGKSSIQETIFENRFMHVPELARMGANIELDGSTATIHGIEQFKSAEVMATDLRASVSLVIAALAAEGESKIHRVYHLDRGYERIEEKLKQCGAQIERIKS